MTARSSRRLAAIALATLVAGAAFAPLDADARAGRSGSFGSRGTRTFSAPPPTATMPGAAPIQRSITQPGPSIGAQAPLQQAPRRGLFGGGLGAGLLGGFLGAGLFGMLFGHGLLGGLGSMSSLFGLLLQVGLIFLAVRFIMGWFARRNGQQPAAIGPAGYRFDPPEESPRSAFGGGFGGSAAGASQPVTLEKSDFDAFERLLGEVQRAWSDQDISRMRSLATPEMVEVFAEDVAQDASRGVINRVSDVKLLQGDLAEAWRENGRDYATVAMRYQLKDWTEDLESGRVVDGDPNVPTEAVELWTFVRANGGRWLLSAIQQSA
ncbi:Tim44 domain-containing protein [Hansschlegelia sp.]|uniref:Tim44 domain-containing protein n=1 Tax=Hansschlegelia sp. TaxID=2041892 RepID=UPI002CCBC7B4|nr:TIM44-like domain-containing protein [Hansschlegelia sp.]HVI27832.1 TIM44-like domain-containing protein [Hansschlegelia sp.]